MPSNQDNTRNPPRDRYIGGLQAKLHVLMAAGERIADPDAVATIVRVVQELRGSGASFEVPEVTAAASAVENAPAAALEERLLDLIAVLERLLAEAAVGGRILLVEDDDDMVGMMQEVLTAPGRFLVRAETVAEAQKLLWAQPFDLVVLDLLLPDGDGRDLLVAMKRRPATAEIPVLALSGKYASHIRNECRLLGVSQFIEKPVDFSRLATTVAEMLERGQDDRAGSGHDQLTGLRKPELFRTMFEQVLAFCRRTGIAVSVALLEIDDLDGIEREHGAMARDDVLVYVAGTIVKSLREEDFSGRWDERTFVVALLGAREEDALFALGRIRQALARDGAPLLGVPNPLYLSLSGGVTELGLGSSIEDGGDDLDTALGRARTLLDRIKAGGQSRIAHASLDDDLARRQVLIAEDDPDAADILCRLLDADDLQVTVCSDGEAALAAARQMTYDLVILDKGLPRRNGFEILTQLRTYPAYRDVPVVMVTSTGEEEEIERAFALGADDYVVKPFRIRVLRARVRRHLRRRKSPSD